MLFMRFTPIRPGIWAVRRRAGAVTIAEVSLKNGRCHLVPRHRLDLDDVDMVAAFMHEVTK